jgi:hypothetical protein
MNIYARLVCALVMLIALPALSSPPARAGHVLITCALDGDGAYGFDAQTNIDSYQWRGEIDRCTSALGAVSPEQGTFTGSGFVATVGASGTGTMTITWANNERSVLEFTMTGIPELLGMTGRVTSGLYVGETMTMELDCKLKDTGACFAPGASTWSFLGTVEFGL